MTPRKIRMKGHRGRWKGWRQEARKDGGQRVEDGR